LSKAACHACRCTNNENSQPIPIPPLQCVQVVQRSGIAGEVGSEFWRPARFVERIYVYLILWRLTVPEMEPVYEIVDVYNERCIL